MHIKLIGSTLLILLVGSCDSGTVDQPIPPNQRGLFDWSVQTSETNESLTDIYFASSGRGWAVGNRVVLATTNGGVSWPETPLDSTNTSPDQLNGVFFINDEMGWLVGFSNELGSGQVYRAEQGGAFTDLQGNFSSALNAVHFLDEVTGWAAGNNGLIIGTMDGGMNWNELQALDSDILDIHYTSNEKGWAVGVDGKLYQTLNGTNFQLLDLGITAQLNAVHFTDTLRGWICGEGNTIYRRHLSNDNQPVWSAAPVAEVSVIIDWRDIFFIDSLNGWVVGTEGNIYGTTDGGVTWTRNSTAAFESFNAIHMISNTSGWIAGENGIIMTYTP